MRELDLQVQSKLFSNYAYHRCAVHMYNILLIIDSLDNIEKRTARFFQNAIHMQSCEVEAEHNFIMKEYKKILEDTGNTG